MILEVSWDNLSTLLLGFHNFMVTALGSCVKSPKLRMIWPKARNNHVVILKQIWLKSIFTHEVATMPLPLASSPFKVN